MRTIFTASAGLLALALLWPNAAAHAAPAPDLYGKSLTVDWTEMRQVRVSGVLRNGPVSFQFRIYVSSTGRVFNKLSASSRAVDAAGEHVGSSGSFLSGGIRSAHFGGHSLTVQSVFGNYARRIYVEVEHGGGTCSVQISVGKQVGAAAKAFRVNGIAFEILSTTVEGSRCAARNGNIFSN
jgi:hypothetical protein